MATVPIPDDLYAQVQQEAARQGSSPANLIRSAIGSFLDSIAVSEPVLTEEQTERMRESVAQMKRGEVVTAEEVDRKFEDFFEKLEARKAAA